MKKTLVALGLLFIVAWGIFVVKPQADGAYYQSNPSQKFSIVMDTGTATTTDSGIVGTPVPAYRFRAIVAKFKLDTPYDTTHGWVLSDTFVIRLRTAMGDGQVKTLDSMRLSPPCSLLTRIPVAVATEDTLFWKDLFWTWKVTDTTSDTLFTVHQPYYWEIIARE